MQPLPLPPPAPPRTTDVAVGAFLGLLLTAVLLVAVVPKFAEIFLQVKVPMPGNTRFLIGISHSVLADRWAAALLLVAVPASLSRLTARQASIARILIPIVALAALGWIGMALFEPLLGCLHGGIGTRR